MCWGSHPTTKQAMTPVNKNQSWVTDESLLSTNRTNEGQDTWQTIFFILLFRLNEYNELLIYTERNQMGLDSDTQF